MQGDGTSASDCETVVRTNGVTYSSVGLGESDATRLSTAGEADCDDAGRDARGPVFPEHSRRVDTWTFPGHSPTEVLGIRADGDSLEILVADSLASEKRTRIEESLLGETR